MFWAALVASVALGVMALLCYKLMRAHEALAAHCRCISDMLSDPEHAEQIARASADDLTERGLMGKGR